MKTLILIDGANASESLKLIKRQINYPKLARTFQSSEIRYYTAILETEDGYSALKPYMDKLQYSGVTTITKPAKVVSRDNRQITKGNMDVEITCDACLMYEHFNQIVLFSGDGDFVYLVNMLRFFGRIVTVVSTSNLHGNYQGLSDNCTIIADELRKAASLFINMNDPGSLAENFLEKRPD